MATIDFTDSIYDAQQGSQSAIQFIYDNTIQLFYKEASVFLRDKNEADCAIRDAYVFILNHLDSLEDSSRFLFWANEVLKNTCITRLKNAGAFKEPIPAEASNLGDILPSSEYDPQINMQASMLTSHVQICLEAILDSLPDNQRACLILWGEGYPLRSIARKLSIPVAAVNYTLAYALGNVTHSVTTLGENGLPLHSMEPIPFFLWLLITYYQYYNPEELIPGIEASFPNILRVMMPQEASVFSAAYDSKSEDLPVDDRIQHITEPSSEFTIRDSSTKFETPVNEKREEEELDLSQFIQADPALVEADAIFDSIAASIQTGEALPKQPEMEIYPAHQEEAEEAQEIPADSKDSEEAGSDVDTETSDAEAALLPKQNEASPAVTEGDAVEDQTSENSEESIDEETASAAGEAESKEAQDTSETLSEKPETEEAQAAPSEFQTEVPDTEDEKKPKRRTGLIVTLLIIIIVLLALAVYGLYFLNDSQKQSINSMLGINLLPVSSTVIDEPESETETSTEEITQPESESEIESVTEPSSEATSETETEAESLDETTSEATEETSTESQEETTTEPESETQVSYDQLPYQVRIYAPWASLGMHSQANGNSQTITYVPYDTEVTVDQIVDNWGHIYYNGSDGWIWMGYVRSDANLEPVQPDNLLDTPQRFTAASGGYGVEMRTGIGDSYTVLSLIPDATTLTVTAYSADGSWAFTRYQDRSGWVLVSNLQAQ